MTDDFWITRFWAGRPLPKEYQLYGRQWSTLNPAYLISTYGEHEVEGLLQPWPEVQKVVDDLYARDGGRKGIELYVQLADIIGYALVERFGGIYVNCDMQPLRTLPKLPDCAWASYENDVDGRIVNAAIGAPEPHDVFWKFVLQDLPTRYWANPTAEMVESTGPAFLTDEVHRYKYDVDFHVFPTHAFNPIHWNQIAQGGDASEFTYPVDSIAVHHWGHKKDGRTNLVETATQ